VEKEPFSAAADVDLRRGEQRMSLNAAQQARTSQELYANLELSGLTAETVRADLHFTEHQLDETLELGPDSRPNDVWQLRDYLEQTILARGASPVPFTVLTEPMRASANAWFGVEDGPAEGHAS
jgi:hypothetical protein